MFILDRLIGQLYQLHISYKLACLCYFLLCSSYISGQADISHYTYDSKDGLNASHIYGIVQDSEGTMWIGTSSGLLEFNGVRFKEVDLPGLRNVEVLQLKIDADDTLWFINLANQLCKYSREDGFSSVQIQDERVHTEIWLTDSLVGVFGNIDFGKVYHKDDLSLTSTTDKTFYIPSLEETLITGSDNNLTLNNTKSNSSSTINITNQKAHSLFEFSKFFGKNYLRFKSTLDLFKLERGKSAHHLKKVHISDKPHQVNSISKISDSILHVNTTIGVFAFDVNFNFLRQYYNGINCTHSIVDDENNLWVTTMSNGIYFSHFSDISSIKYYAGSSISELYPLSKTLWIGTQNGEISRYDKETVKSINDRPESGPIRFILSNSMEQIIVGQNDKLILFKKNQDKFKELKTPSMPGCQKRALFISDSLIAIGTCGSTSIYTIFINSLLKSKMINSGRVYSIFYEKADSSLIISTSKGLIKYDSAYRPLPFLSGILPNTITVIKIVKSSNGILWIVSNNAGIYGILNNQILYHFNKDHLLNTNSINDLFVSNRNELWISTTSGVNVIDSTHSKSSFITQKDGLLSNIVHKITHWNEEVYVGTSKGLNVFKKNTSFNNDTPPPIYLDQIIVDGDNNDLSELTGKEFNYRFKFHGINYSSLGEFQYKYRMLGLSDSWEFITSDIDEIVYNKLPPNDYSFEIYAINEDGVESIQPATISFTVPEPFYQRWWFYALALLLSIGIISTAFQFRLRQIRRKNKIEQKIRSHQLTALKAQMKPHFISNILNSIQSHSMLQDPLMVNSYITKLSSFVRKVLNMSDAETVSLESELAVLKTYIELELLRSDHPFTYDIVIDPKLNCRSYFIPPMLIQPYVENAIKHGMTGQSKDHLNLMFKLNHYGKLIVSIIDNGPGINSSKVPSHKTNGHISLGTEINSDRIDLLRLTYKQNFTVKTINLSDTLSSFSGTEVVLEIPNIAN